MDQIVWAEIYRPKTVKECILPERILEPFLKYVEKKEVPNLLLYGTTGVGKTTVVKAMCNEIGCDHMVINGSDENGVDTIRVKIKNYASSVSLSGGRKVVIIDEADYLSLSAQAALRASIEDFSNNCSFVFTCNYKSKIMNAIHSRCACIDFTFRGQEKTLLAAAFFKRVMNILNQEKVEFEQKVVAEIVRKFFPDFRRTINELQRYSKFGKIDSGVLSMVSNVTMTEVVKYIREKNFGELRKNVAANDYDADFFFRQLYDSLYEFVKPTSIPQAVIIIADYQYKQAFVADTEINIMACLTELMVSCEFI